MPFAMLNTMNANTCFNAGPNGNGLTATDWQNIALDLLTSDASNPLFYSRCQTYFSSVPVRWRLAMTTSNQFLVNNNAAAPLYKVALWMAQQLTGANLGAIITINLIDKNPTGTGPVNVAVNVQYPTNMTPPNQCDYDNYGDALPNVIVTITIS